VLTQLVFSGVPDRQHRFHLRNITRMILAVQVFGRRCQPISSRSWTKTFLRQEGRYRFRAGFIKIAFEETLEQSPAHLIEAAVAASLATGAAIQAHRARPGG
jgi:hypothetical protein